MIINLDQEEFLRDDPRLIKNFEFVVENILDKKITPDLGTRVQVLFGKTARFLDVVTLQKYKYYLSDKSGAITIESKDKLYSPLAISIRDFHIGLLRDHKGIRTTLRDYIEELIEDDDKLRYDLEEHIQKINISKSSGNTIGGKAGEKTNFTNITLDNRPTLLFLALDMKYFWDEYRIIIDIESETLSSAVNYLMWEIMVGQACMSPNNIDKIFEKKFQENTLVLISPDLSPYCINLIGADRSNKGSRSESSLKRIDHKSFALGVIDKVTDKEISIIEMPLVGRAREMMYKTYNKSDFFTTIPKTKAKITQFWYGQGDDKVPVVIPPEDFLSRRRIILPAEDCWDLLHPLSSEIALPRDKRKGKGEMAMVDTITPLDWEKQV